MTAWGSEILAVEAEVRARKVSRSDAPAVVPVPVGPIAAMIVAPLPAIPEPVAPVQPDELVTAEPSAPVMVFVLPTRRKRGQRRKDVASRMFRCADIPGIELLASDPCAYCGSLEATTHDHIVPVSRGGEHSLDNVVRACWACNRAKNTMPLLAFLARRALLRRIAA